MISQREEKEYFAEFMEDYNTATLPHKKYYNMEAWEAWYNAKNRGKQESALLGMTDEERLKYVTCVCVFVGRAPISLYNISVALCLHP